MTGSPPVPRRDDPPPQRLAPSRGYLLLAALALAAVPLAWWWAGSGRADMPSSPPSLPAAPAALPSPAAVATAVSPVPAPSGPTAPATATAEPPNLIAPAPPLTAARPVRDPQGDPTPDLADLLNPGEVPTMAEVIARLNAAGVTSGLGAFQPPGTRPPLIGLAVPPDFVLPPGYVRHHQATDDGQRIEAILMFAPDAQLVDANGRPVALPANRVVPPELAPPGLPIRSIVLPAPLAPGR
ncbi:MAG: hypothetical protein U1F56_12250 [Rubrivivax sp.]